MNLPEKIASRYVLSKGLDDYDVKDLLSYTEKYRRNSYFHEWVKYGYEEIMDDFFTSDSTTLSSEDELLDHLGYSEDHSYREEWSKLDPEVLYRSDKFREWFFREWAPQRLNSIREDIKEEVHIENGKMKIWRALEGPPVSLPYESWREYFSSSDTHHLGVYWSYSKEGASSYFYDEELQGPGRDVLIKGKVAPDKVDWRKTLAQHMFGGYHDTEKEVRLFKGTPLEVEKIEFEDKTLTKQEMKEQDMNTEFVA